MLGDKLKMLREKKGLNKKQMAQELGLQYMTYCRYEGNEREPSNDVLISIADYFNITVDYLIGNTLKFDIYPREYEEFEMKCPECGCENIHFIRTMAVEFGNEKSNGCSIEFYCEEGHNFYLVFETFKGCTYSMYFGKNAAIAKPLETSAYDSGIYSLEDAFVEGIFEQKMKEYKSLDSYGKKAVESILNVEYERCSNRHMNSATETHANHDMLEMKRAARDGRKISTEMITREEANAIKSMPDTPEDL